MDLVAVGSATADRVRVVGVASARSVAAVMAAEKADWVAAWVAVAAKGTRW